MSTFAIADPSFHPLMLSSRLISELAQARSTLRATTERCDLAVIVSAGGELDASNDAVWRRLLSEAAAAAAPPGPLVVDISGLDFMGCCAYSALAHSEGVWSQRGAARRRQRGRRAVGVHPRRLTRARCLVANALGGIEVRISWVSPVCERSARTRRHRAR
jgi:anti-anti-sigma factor